MLAITPPIAFGLTTLGIIHTLISLIAVVTGIILLVRDGKISWDTTTGKIYVITTVITCLTGFGIFQHDGFGKPHALGIITLLVLVIAYAAHSSQGKFGKIRPYVETVSYSATFFFHIIPGITETATRLPLDAPLAASPEDAGIKMAIGFCFVLFIAGVIWQIIKLRANSKQVGSNP